MTHVLKEAVCASALYTLTTYLSPSELKNTTFTRRFTLVCLCWSPLRTLTSTHQCTPVILTWLNLFTFFIMVVLGGGRHRNLIPNKWRRIYIPQLKGRRPLGFKKRVFKFAFKPGVNGGNQMLPKSPIVTVRKINSEMWESWWQGWWCGSGDDNELL